MQAQADARNAATTRQQKATEARIRGHRQARFILRMEHPDRAMICREAAKALHDSVMEQAWWLGVLS